MTFKSTNLTITNLFIVQRFICNAFSSYSQVTCTVFLKVFNKLNNIILASKFHAFGIRDPFHI